MPRKGGRKTMRGGVGAADHAISVYGGIGQQQAVGANDNTIVMKPSSGGSRRRKSRSAKKRRSGRTRKH